ncbi:MAG: hypothetical protein JWQ68_1489 [Cryobacterium sp.]|nr:hypothetical protein [Cryobacterium sp.]
MRVVYRENGTVVVELSALERMSLAALARQLVDVLLDDTDPVMERLLPNAYPDDAEAAAEFRRFTADELFEQKISGARAMLAELDDESPSTRSIALDESIARQWMATLTDLRLVIAERLGIRTDGDEGRMDNAAEPLQRTYFWLGAVQESLVAALYR